MRAKDIFLICSVRNASEETLARQSDYVKSLEDSGHTVHYPPRDTNQKQRGLEICDENLRAMLNAQEIHVFYSPDSQGCHFDMGMAFVLSKITGKRIVVASNVPYGEGKSYPRMLDELAKHRWP
jgi:hypothetical protein